MDFTAIKYSVQGSFKVKKRTIDKLLYLLKTIGIPKASENDPLINSKLISELVSSDKTVF